MTDFLTIDGVAYGVLEGGAEQTDSDVVGEEKRAIDGTLRSDVQATKDNYRFTLEPMPNASYLTLKAKASSGNFYACGGAAVPAHNYSLRITSAGYARVELDFVRTVQIALRQQ